MAPGSHRARSAAQAARPCLTCAACPLHHVCLLPVPSLRPQGGRFDEDGITALLLAPGARGDPAVSGTRNLADNLSDLKAQASKRLH